MKQLIRTLTAFLLILLLALPRTGFAAQTEETTAAEETEAAADETEEAVPEPAPYQELSIVVTADSEITNIFGLKEKNLGLQSHLDRQYTDQALAQLQSVNSDTLTTRDFFGIGKMVDALYEGEVDAALISQSFLDMLLEETPEMEEEIRIVYTFRFTPQEDETGLLSTRERTTVDVSKEPFIVYLSGIDTYGSVLARSRSDVNILAVANPTTHQILLVTTPRDYYVELPIAGNAMDKLTHAGIYGIDASIETLEQLYEIGINYFARVNFTGFINIIDALGGVDVYSSRSFTGEVFHVPFTEGINHVDGREALSFVRERHSFADGDWQRQRNQMEMVKAVMNKLSSPSILLTYPTLLEAVADAFTTDLTYDELTTLIKTLLDSSDWNVQTYGVTGEGVRRTTYSMGNRSLYVALQDEESIAEAKALMQLVLDGELLPEPQEEETAEETEAE